MNKVKMGRVLLKRNTSSKPRLNALRSLAACSFAWTICSTASTGFPAGSLPAAFHKAVEQNEAVGSAVVSGVIVDATTGGAISNATVTIGAPAGGPKSTILTDASGRFTVSGVPPGSDQLEVVASGYLPGGYGQLWPGGPQERLRLTAGAREHEIKIRLWRPAAIFGKVTDDYEKPLVGVTVHLMAPPGSVDDRNVLKRSALTDERGTYRFTDLRPGKYVIGVINLYLASRHQATSANGDQLESVRSTLIPFKTPFAPVTENDGSMTVVPTTFYPAAPDLRQAEVIQCGPGEERLDVRLALARVPTVSVSGTLLGPRGPLGGAQVYVIRAGSADDHRSLELAHAIATTDSKGRFVVPGVAPGDYEFRAEYRSPSGKPQGPILTTNEIGLPIVTGVVPGTKPVSDADPLLVARLRLPVGTSPITDAMLALSPGPSLTGLLRFEGKRKPPPLKAASIKVEPVDERNAGAMAQVDPEGAFHFPSLSPTEYVLSVYGLPGWLLRSVQINGRDPSAGPLDLRYAFSHKAVVTLSDRLPSIEGRVIDKSERPDPSAVVFVFPADTKLWSIAGASDSMVMVRASADGTFATGPLRPADYAVVAASAPIFAWDWREPDMLRNLGKRSTRVSLRDSTQTLTLRSEHVP